MRTYVYPTPIETARALIEKILHLMKEDGNKIYHIAFSGGSTPSLMFDLWANEYKDATPWERLRIYWVDERCVPPEDPESNYGTMRRLLLERVPLKNEFIFPINGVNLPNEEAKRYSDQIYQTVPAKQNRPFFDIILLGAGDDGHTSSIFPGQEDLLTASEPYKVSRNPYSGQIRIAMTGYLLLHAQKVIFLITGKSKEKVVKNILSSKENGPAAYVAHCASDVELFLDDQANEKGGRIDPKNRLVNIRQVH